MQGATLTRVLGTGVSDALRCTVAGECAGRTLTWFALTRQGALVWIERAPPSTLRR